MSTSGSGLIRRKATKFLEIWSHSFDALHSIRGPCIDEESGKNRINDQGAGDVIVRRIWPFFGVRHTKHPS